MLTVIVFSALAMQSMAWSGAQLATRPLRSSIVLQADIDLVEELRTELSEAYLRTEAQRIALDRFQSVVRDRRLTDQASEPQTALSDSLERNCELQMELETERQQNRQLTLALEEALLLVETQNEEIDELYEDLRTADEADTAARSELVGRVVPTASAVISSRPHPLS